MKSYNSIHYSLILLLIISLVSGLGAQDKNEANSFISNNRNNMITRTVAESSPAVAGINATQIREFSRTPFDKDPIWSLLFPDRVFRQRIKSLGSGFLISSDGFVLTNTHVIENAEEVVVTLSDGTDHNADIVGIDEVSDIALLKIKGKDFPFLKINLKSSIPILPLPNSIIVPTSDLTI